MTQHGIYVSRMLHLASLPKQSCNTSQSISGSVRQDPFGQGVNVIVGCLGTKVCRASSAWDLIQFQWARQASPTVSFFQLSGQPLSRGMMVGHIKGLLAKLGLNSSLYIGYSLCIRGAMMAASASLRDWEIKSLGHCKNNTYQTYIRETTDMKINCARRMACTPASITLNYSHHI